MRTYQASSPAKSSNSLSVSHIKPTQDHFTFESQAESQSLSRTSFRVKTEKDEIENQAQHRQRIERQMKLKIQSLTKGFQIKMGRQKQTFELKQLKYQQEIMYLKNQVSGLTQVKKNKNRQNSQSHCNICSNGEVITHMKNMLEEIQNNHRGCIVEKSSQNARILQLEQKLSVLEHELKYEEQKSKKLKDENRRIRNEIDVNEREKRERQRVYRERQRAAQVKQIELQEEIKKQKELQAKLENQINKIAYDHSKMDAIPQSPQKMYSQRQPFTYVQERQNRDYHDSIERCNRLKINLPRQPSLRERQMFRNTNSSHIQASWKTKMEESYAEYAQSKKKYKKCEQKPLENSALYRMSGNRGQQIYPFRGGRYNYL